ncbi:hypothetical protein lbkm_4250 [Lachnospiraceae bacterium KM106-2]|nr:hypothetical protein lbkm_4250 [Lachnospiraceae bacterium KM106-2]
MKELYRERLEEGMLKVGVITGFIITAVLMVGQIGVWLLEEKQVTGAVLKTRGLCTYVSFTFLFVALLVILFLKFELRRNYVNCFYINRKVIFQVKRSLLVKHSLLFACITLLFQGIYAAGHENFYFILVLQFMINLLLFMGLALWADNFSMYSIALELLYMAIFFVLLIRPIIVYREKADFLVTSIPKAIIYVILLLTVDIIGVVWNEKLMAKEDFKMDAAGESE